MEVEAYAKKILALAHHYRTSDIHLMPEAGHYQIYYRLSGKMVQQFSLSVKEGESLISYLKFLANMDVGERRRPQSGSCSLKLPDVTDLRLSTIANYRGQESLVIRLLASQEEGQSRADCFFDHERQVLEDLVKYKSGLILFAGPVDSGKTTTMYRLVKKRSASRKQQVISIEDPVEIEEADFLQVQVNEAGGVTYEALIKSSLRHHPDVLLVGEIRDEETARMVIRGALTGHLIIASVHAKDAAGVVDRLQELGISPEVLGQTLIGLAFQKLLPKYCPFCQGDCQTACNHIPADQKRAVLYDVRYGKSLQNLLARRQGNHTSLADQPRSFNHLLKKVYVYGFISQETYQSYKIP